jgi:hypothetical protein
MSTTHTPGPWTFKHAGDESGDIGILSDGPAVVAECFPDIRIRDEGAHDECLANARLIAAAPELLEALRNLICDHGGSRAVSRDDERAIAACAAISKATGA